MIWPFKKKEVEEKEVDDSVEESSKQIFEDEKERSRFSKLVADVDKLKALMISLEEKLRINNEKFTRINEQIGELRASSVEKEKQIKDMEVAAMKATDIVKEIQPEKFMSELKKEDIKIEKTATQMERYEETLSQVIFELKDIRSRIDLFKGYEELLKLNEETKEDLKSIKRLEITMDIHTNKMEKLFIDFQKKYAEFETFQEIAIYIEEIYRNVIKEINELKVKSINLVEKKQIIGLEKAVMEKLSKLDEFMNKKENFIEPKLKELMEINKYHEGELNKIKATLNNMNNLYEDIYNYIKKLSGKIQ